MRSIIFMIKTFCKNKKSFQYNEKFYQNKDNPAYEFGRFYLILAYELGKKYCKKCYNRLKITLLCFCRVFPRKMTGKIIIFVPKLKTLRSFNSKLQTEQLQTAN